MQTQSIEINSEWPCHPVKAVGIWSITALFILVQFFLQLSVGVIADNLRESLFLDAFQLSLLSSGYYIIYVILQTPAGILIDRLEGEKNGKE